MRCRVNIVKEEARNNVIAVLMLLKTRARRVLRDTRLCFFSFSPLKSAIFLRLRGQDCANPWRIFQFKEDSHLRDSFVKR